MNYALPNIAKSTEVAKRSREQVQMTPSGDQQGRKIAPN